MDITELKPGWHMAHQEAPFVAKVVGSIRKANYQESIQVVGSRVDGWRVSKNNFRIYCGDLEPEAQVYWADQLNNIARKRDLPANRIIELLRYVGKNCPVAVINFLANPRYASSDLDLLIGQERSQIPIEFSHTDPHSGLTIEIWEPGEYDKIPPYIPYF